MTDKGRGLVIAHGAGLVLLGLGLGLAAVVEELAGSSPQTWRAAHNALLLAGVWLLAVGAVLPALVLSTERQAALSWSLLVTAWAFTTAILVQAVTGVRTLGPGDNLAGWIGFGANILTVGAGFFAALLTLIGAVAALRRSDRA